MTAPKPENGNQSGVRVTWVQGGSEVNRQVPADQVVTQMGQVLTTARTAQPDARMIVKMDKDAPYGVMADLMPALQAAKASRFNVQTDLEGKRGLFSKTGGK